MTKLVLSLVPLLFLACGCAHVESSTAEDDYAKPSGTTLVFAWPFLKPEQLPYRGGSTQGTEVTLEAGASDSWRELQAENLSALERDRRAILAMAGDYRVSFQFTETAGFYDKYAPSKPYFSWGTECVRVLEDSARFISLQHMLVMWFKDESGAVHGPMVMKHWRQDWRFEDRDLHEYQRDGVHAQRQVAAKAVAGTWTQAVFQVDDSPRYEVIGRWQHGSGLAIWHSRDCRRPLPRREFSVHDDYNVLKGRHTITITPTGWVHEQHNRKLSHSDAGMVYRAQEIGVNRYERISAPDLSAGDESLAKTAHYWQAVRDVWQAVKEQHPRFKVAAKIDGKKLYELHFSHAATIAGGDIDRERDVRHAQETIDRYVTGLKE